MSAACASRTSPEFRVLLHQQAGVAAVVVVVELATGVVRLQGAVPAHHLEQHLPVAPVGLPDKGKQLVVHSGVLAVEREKFLFHMNSH